MQAEIEAYEYQLSQVKLALEADPSNAEISALKSELEELISLTKQAAGISGQASSAPVASPAPSKAKGKAKETASPAPAAAASSSATSTKATGTPTPDRPKLSAGDECSAKYKDGKWYPARITSVAGAADSPVYTVIFKGYTAPQTLAANQVRPVANSSSHGSPDVSSSTVHALSAKRKLTAEEIEKEKEKKKKKNEKWTETMNAKTQVTVQKKNAWESFGKKAAKKGVKIGGLEGKSIFRTPDNPTGRVGVVGSGQGLVPFEQRGKHKFGGSAETED